MGGTLRTRTIRFAKDGRVYDKDVEEILGLFREAGNVYVFRIDEDVMELATRCLYPGLVDYDPSTREFINLWKEYIGKDYPKLCAKFEILESSHMHSVVKRYDGAVFRFEDIYPAEILENIYINNCISLWDLIVLEEMIFMKDSPQLFEQDPDFRIRLADNIVTLVGFFAYVFDLIDIVF